MILLPPDYKRGDTLHTISAIISTAYSLIGFEFGLLVEVAAQTGARYSQLIALTVDDVQLQGNPQLTIPVSNKGWGEKELSHLPAPIMVGLAHRLPIQGRPLHAPLLMKAHDTPWAVKDRDYPRWFQQIVDHLKDDPIIANARFKVTMYSLRHTSIARQLLDNVNPKIVADNHDTSLAMLQRTYAKFLTNHSDAISRGSLSAAFGSNVVSLPTAKVG